MTCKQKAARLLKVRGCALSRIAVSSFNPAWRWD